MNEDDGCTLDQWLTSAMAAMLFASRNWEKFCKFMPSVTGDPVPIGPDDMVHHAWHLGELADPSRMPS